MEGHDGEGHRVTARPEDIELGGRFTFERLVEGLANDLSPNLRGSGANLVQLCVAEDPAGGVVVDVPVPTET